MYEEMRRRKGHQRASGKTVQIYAREGGSERLRSGCWFHAPNHLTNDGARSWRACPVIESNVVALPTGRPHHNQWAGLVREKPRICAFQRAEEHLGLGPSAGRDLAVVASYPMSDGRVSRQRQHAEDGGRRRNSLIDFSRQHCYLRWRTADPLLSTQRILQNSRPDLYTRPRPAMRRRSWNAVVVSAE